MAKASRLYIHSSQLQNKQYHKGLLMNECDDYMKVKQQNQDHNPAADPYEMKISRINSSLGKMDQLKGEESSYADPNLLLRIYSSSQGRSS